MNKSKFKQEIEKYLADPKNKLLLIALGILFAVILFQALLPKDKEAVRADPLTADTVIPAGYVLVPIELENAASMTSIIGDFGVVDLFSAKTEKHPKGLRVGRRLKLIRAPLNPDQFAVFVPEDESVLLREAQGPFFAVIQNPTVSEPETVIKKSAKRKSRIEYYSQGESL